jgi:aryl-alcohol dehydrogenase-like predicted oxidoreductase
VSWQLTRELELKNWTQTQQHYGTTLIPEWPLNHGILRRDSVTRTD